MSKKKITIIIIIFAIVNLVALALIFWYLDKKQAETGTGKVTVTSSTAPADSTAAKKKTAAPHGVFSKVIQDIKKEEARLKKKMEARKVMLLKNDTLKPPSRSVHQSHLQTFKKKLVQGEKNWEKELNIVHNAKLKGKFRRNPLSDVFGWHPYWMGNAYRSYNFSLLSTIAYFSYELDPATGSYETVHDWPTTALVDSAHKAGCDILLTVTCFGEKKIGEFLGNEVAQQTFITTLDSLLLLREANGVNIDFEGVPGGEGSAAFVSFVKRMHDELKAYDESYIITIAIPAVDWQRAYDLAALDPYVDQFIIMGYDYYGEQSETAGPVAPLHSGDVWWQYNLKRTVDAYKKQVAASKLLMGLPYYGAQWVTEDAGTPSKKRAFIGHRLYRDLKYKFRKLDNIRLDTLSMTAHHTEYDEGTRQFRQTWFDNATTLDQKIHWVQEQGLGGIGIWALGYDNGNTEFWDVLKKRFELGASRVPPPITYSVPPKSHVVPADTIEPAASGAHPGGVKDLLKGEKKEFGLVMFDGTYFVLDNPLALVLGLLACVLIVFLLLLVLDITPWKDRYLVRLIIYAVISLLLLVSIAFLALQWMLGYNSYVLALGGVLVGFVLSRVAARFVKAREERLP
jgi:spore germination protein YaaH